MVRYDFDVEDFLAKWIHDLGLGREKLFLAYPCMITQILFVTGVQTLLEIN